MQSTEHDSSNTSACDNHHDGHGGASHIPTGNEDGYGKAIGIDTIGLLTSDFEIDEGAELQVRSASNVGTGETVDGPLYRPGGDGPPVDGVRAFVNLGEISATVYGPDALYFEATLPCLIEANNRRPVDTRLRFQMAVDAAGKRLREFGVAADLFGADISRLDICRNIRTAGRLPDYEPVLRRCSFPRTETRRYEDGGFHWTNDSRELLLYGKGAKEDTDPHVQRLEYRLTRKRAVEAQVGTSSVVGLLSDFGTVRRAYRSAVDELLPDVENVEDASSTSLRGGMLAMIERAEKRTSFPHSKALKAFGLRYLQERNAAEEFLKALKEDAGRMAVSRYRQTFDELTPLADLLSEKERTVTDMVEELRAKLLE